MKNKYYPKGTILAALDIGSHKVACLICRYVDEQNGFEILGVGHHSSSGVKNGLIVDLEAADSAIRQTIHAAESMAALSTKGYPLRDIVINVPNNKIQSEIFEIQAELIGDLVQAKDLAGMLYQAQEQAFSQDKELIHTIPYGYKLDEHSGIQKPIDMKGEVLSSKVHIISAPITALENYASCIEKCHLDLVGLCSSSYAAGLSCLVEDEIDLGSIVIDMGASQTGFSIFQEGKLIYSDSVPVGGWHVTNDISKGLLCSLDNAERIKTLYGHAMVTIHDDNEMIEVPQIGETEEENHISRSMLIGIIQPRLEEVFEMIKQRLDAYDSNEVVSRRVVLTGGASQMPGLRELSQLILNKQIRLGRPIQTSGLPDAASGPSFSTVTGLLSYFSIRQDEIPSNIERNADGVSLLDKFKVWWKENW